MVELQYFETGCKENYILRKTTVKFIILIFRIFGEKFILKHYMHRNIPKRRVLKVLWTAPYESEVYFTWRRLLLTLLIYFHAYKASVNFLYFTHTLKLKKILFTVHILIFWGYVLKWCFSHFCKKTKIANFEINFAFLFSCKIRLAGLTRQYTRQK